MRLEWDESLSVGNAIIDAQHRKLLEIVNRLSEAIGTKALRSELSSIVKELERYAAIHFHHEETKMREALYPDLVEHQREHRRFEEKLAGLSGQLRKGSGFAAASALRWLGDWYSNHILLVDRKYAPWLGKAEIRAGAALAEEPTGSPDDSPDDSPDAVDGANGAVAGDEPASR